jgi:hypothetical protein
MEKSMPTRKPKTQTRATPKLQLGETVKVRHHEHLLGRIVELRGPLGPGGAYVYRVVFGRKPLRRSIELREDQLIVVPARKGPSPSTEPANGPSSS